MLPPELRHILGCLACQISFWKYNGKSIVWRFKILTKTLQRKNLEYKYGCLLFKSALRINFWLWEVEVKNWFRKQNLKENDQISILKIFLKGFSVNIKKKKKSHCIFKKLFDRHFLKKPNTAKYALVWVVACQKLKSNSAR